LLINPFKTYVTDDIVSSLVGHESKPSHRA
jgi:hypothetical protein